MSVRSAQPPKFPVGTRVRICKGWWDAGRSGVAVATMINECTGTTWVGVLWDDEDDPDWHKERGLEIVPEVAGGA